MYKTTTYVDILIVNREYMDESKELQAVVFY
jgi:hypothetical protein